MRNLKIKVTATPRVEPDPPVTLTIVCPESLAVWVLQLIGNAPSTLVGVVDLYNELKNALHMRGLSV